MSFLNWIESQVSMIVFWHAPDYMNTKPGSYDPSTPKWLADARKHNEERERKQINESDLSDQRGSDTDGD